MKKSKFENIVSFIKSQPYRQPELVDICYCPPLFAEMSMKQLDIIKPLLVEKGVGVWNYGKVELISGVILK